MNANVYAHPRISKSKKHRPQWRFGLYGACHPDDPHWALGLCRSCYRKAKYQHYKMLTAGDGR